MVERIESVGNVGIGESTKLSFSLSISNSDLGKPVDRRVGVVLVGCAGIAV